MSGYTSNAYHSLWRKSRAGALRSELDPDFALGRSSRTNVFRGIVSWLLLTVIAQAALVNYVETAVNDADGSTIGAVSSDQWLTANASYTTSTAPITWSSYRFTHWSNDGYPSASYRDAWGRAANPASFVLQVASTSTAHYLPATLDADSDSVPDWFEIEYYGSLAHDATSDSDADGITLLAEYTGGTNPLYPNTAQAGGVTWADSALVACNFAGYATYSLVSDPTGTVNQSASVAPGTVVITPDMSGNTAFGYWTLDGTRQQDAWGVAYTQLTFTMASSDRVATAHLFTGDTDADGVPDAYEMRYYGTLANNASSDTDGDGITLLAEYTGGTSPLYANTAQAGGVAWADSALIACNLAGYSTYTLTSDPTGTVNQSAAVPPGTVVTTPDMSSDASFGYWTLDGTRQQDAWGVAYAQLTFTMASTNRTAIAHLFTGDTDADGVPDAYEQRYYGTLANDASSDTDGDGITLLAEYTGGTSPLYADTSQAGGVTWADSALMTVDLQAEIGIEQPAGTDLTDGGSHDFGSVQVGASTSLTFTITNHGGIDLTGLTLTIDGTNATEFGMTAAPIAPVSHGNSTTFTIQFSPASVGSKSASLHLASNDANESPFDLTLTGTGSPASQTITFDPLATHLVGDPPFTLEATATSGLTVVFTSSDPSVATINGNTVTIVGTGATTITATQSGNTDYSAATPVDRTLTIAAGFAGWQAQHFTSDELGNDTISGPGADPDHDGLSNLIEYALGLDPRVANTTGRPEVSSDSTSWVFTYTRPTDRIGITYDVEVSTDLVNWTDAGVTHTRLSSANGTDVWQASFPLASAPTLFFRLKVIQP